MNPSWAKLGRVLFALPFAVFGLLHLFKAGDMAGMVPEYIPGGVLWVYVTGLIFLWFALEALRHGKSMRKAGLTLAVVLGIFVVTIHLPLVMDPQTVAMGLPNFLKDIALAGAALFFASHARN